MKTLQDLPRLQVVLMAAGASARFSNAGYQAPKCLLPVHRNGKTRSILEWNFEFASRLSCLQPVLVASPTIIWYAEYLQRSGPVKERPQAKLVSVFNLQPGAAFSAYLASAYLDPELPTVLIDTDNLYTDPNPILLWNSNASSDTRSVQATSFSTLIPPMNQGAFRELEPDGRPVLFGYSSEYSIRPGGHTGKITDLESASSYAVNVGIYGFNSWRVFQRSFFEMGSRFFQDTDQPAELSVLAVAKDVRGCAPISGYSPNRIPYESWTPMGTPVQYESNKGF